jgi:cyclase
MTLALRVVGVVLVDDGWVVQTRRFKITTRIGDAYHVIDRLNTWGVDQIMLLDITRGRVKFDPMFVKLLERARAKCFVPLTVGGKISSVDHAAILIENGADQVCVNTHAYDHGLLDGIARKFGSQALVMSCDISIYHDNAAPFPLIRHATEWAPIGFRDAMSKAFNDGVGELMINVVERDGTSEGYAIGLIEYVRSEGFPAPLIAMGGATKPEHFVAGAKAGADALAAGNIFHRVEHATRPIKKALHEAGFPVRMVEEFDPA